MQPSEDISALFQRFGADASTYREIHRDAQVQEAIARWPQAMLAQRRSALAPALVDRSERSGVGAQSAGGQEPLLWAQGPEALPSRIVAVTAAQGGAGVTSVAAYLAVACARMDAAGVVVAVDLSPNNLLAWCAGGLKHSHAGLARSTLAQQPWRAAVQRTAGGAHVLAQGDVRDEDRQRLDVHIASNPQWLRQHLASLQLPARSLVLLDAGCTPSPAMRQALGLAHAVVAVHQPDVASWMAWGALDRLLERYCHARSDFLGCLHAINQVNMAVGLGRDITTIMQQQWSSDGVAVVHRDEAVRQAWAQGVDVQSAMPHSQAALDMGLLAQQLLTRLAGASTDAKGTP